MRHLERDDSLRASCFHALDALRIIRGPHGLPFKGALDQGFWHDNGRIPFLSLQRGIHRAAAQQGLAALSVQTSARTPYGDRETPDGFLYAYQAGSIDLAANRALRAAHALGVPLVHFHATRPGVYYPDYPVFVTADDPSDGFVTLSGTARRLPPDGFPTQSGVADAEREYALYEQRRRLHQARFRSQVLAAYGDRCTVCRLREQQLLDAAHIVADAAPGGDPVVPNGLSLCSIHHRAFDSDLLGISPDYEVRIHPRLLDDDDGPMLELLKNAERTRIVLPRPHVLRPDPDRLAQRFERFLATD